MNDKKHCCMYWSHHYITRPLHINIIPPYCPECGLAIKEDNIDLPEEITHPQILAEYKFNQLIRHLKKKEKNANK